MELPLIEHKSSAVGEKRSPPPPSPNGTAASMGYVKRTRTSSTPIYLPPIVPESSASELSRHRCPHHPTEVIAKGDRPCLLSEYANKYTGYPIELRSSCKPEQGAVQSSEPIQKVTTNRVDFVPHAVAKPAFHKPDQYVAPQGQIDSLTSYTQEYPAKPIHPAKAVRRDLTRKFPGQFEGDPTYKHDYRKWPIKPTEKIVNDLGYQPPSQPFQGASHYTTDYQKYRQGPRESMRPAEVSKSTNEPFSKDTGYRVDYIRHPLPPREQREKAKWMPTKAQLDALSNYMKDYVAKDAPMVASCKPQQGAVQSDAPFEDGTTHRTDFKRWQGDRPQQRQAPPYVKPEGDVNYNTTMLTDFNRKPINLRVAICPTGRKGDPGKFNSATNYRKDFRRWPLEGRPQLVYRSLHVPPSAPFEGTSRYHDDYIGHRQAVRSSMKPTEGAHVNTEPFDGKTGYRDDYVKHKLSARPQKEAPKWQPNTSKLDDLSNYRKDYVGKETGKQASCKPDAQPVQSDAPFEDSTTQRNDYQRWPTERVTQRDDAMYVKPIGDMDMATTSGMAFTKKPIVLVSAKRPSQRKGQSGKFDGTTNYTEDFRGWKPGERPKITMRPDYVAPEAPFEGKSHYTDDYIRYRQSPRSSMRPMEAAPNSDVPFVGHTEYRQEYIKKASLPCPAAVLDTARARYVFADSVPGGHKFYRPMPESRGIQNAAMNTQLIASVA